jgi:hypothetical protein
VAMVIAPKAGAIEINQAGPAQVMGAGLKTASGIAFDFVGATRAPVAVMLWSGDGNIFYVRRYTAPATLEAISLKVPEGASLIIPVNAFKVSGTDTFRVRMFINATAVTDSVYAVPMYR